MESDFEGLVEFDAGLELDGLGLHQGLFLSLGNVFFEGVWEEVEGDELLAEDGGNFEVGEPHSNSSIDVIDLEHLGGYAGL